jgi:hypothetical protein
LKLQNVESIYKQINKSHIQSQLKGIKQFRSSNLNLKSPIFKTTYPATISKKESSRSTIEVNVSPGAGSPPEAQRKRFTFAEADQSLIESTNGSFYKHKASVLDKRQQDNTSRNEGGKVLASSPYGSNNSK